ncbi:MAG: hypothetical protein WCH43_06950 [Verrucomicrobiota bacterium]
MSDIEFEWEGYEYRKEDIEESWDMDILSADEYEACEGFKTLPVELAANLRHARQMELVKLRDGRFFLLWEECSPELGSYYRWLKERRRKSSEKLLNEYKKLEYHNPPISYADQISRADAVKLITWAWMPEEFHKDLGVLVKDKTVAHDRVVRISRNDFCKLSTAYN